MPKGVYPTNFGRKKGATWNPENRAKAYAEPGRRLPGRQPGTPAPESQKLKLRRHNLKGRTQAALGACEALATLVDRE